MIRSLDSAFRAFGHGMRWMLRRPLTSLTSTLCLGIGMAACAVVWTLLDATIFRPFGLADSDRLVVVWEADLSRGQDLIEVSHPNFLDWQRESRTVESMAAFGSSHWPALARIGPETVPMAARGVSGTFFSTLGIQPALGRDFAASDVKSGVAPPVILSHRAWQSRFAGSATIIGQLLFIDGKDHSIIGVMPRAGDCHRAHPDHWDLVQSVLSPGRLLATLTSLLGGAGLLLLTLGIVGAVATALRPAWAEIGVRQAVGATPVQAAVAPLRVLGLALVTGIVAGLLLAPLALSAVEGLGITSGGMLWPLLAGALSVLGAAAVAAVPSIWRASRLSPVDLLREQ